jgi:CheY-like chemotaxis protein
MAEQTEQLKSILVVDGDVLVRHAISDYLRRCGYTVIEASSTDEAVAVLSDETLTIDAILCDAEAPGSLNAFQLREWASQQPHRQGMEIALAGNIEAAAHKAAELCDHGPHLARPYDPQSVVAYIRRLLGAAR